MRANLSSVFISCSGERFNADSRIGDETFRASVLKAKAAALADRAKRARSVHEQNRMGEHYDALCGLVGRLRNELLRASALNAQAGAFVALAPSERTGVRYDALTGAYAAMSCNRRDILKAQLAAFSALAPQERTLWRRKALVSITSSVAKLG
jgi:hypothetical protein